jgi:hypothetical protein
MSQENKLEFPRELLHDLSKQPKTEKMAIQHSNTAIELSFPVRGDCGTTRHLTGDQKTKLDSDVNDLLVIANPEAELRKSVDL